ncbi:MAG: hypothetical protein ACLP50_34560 [Solirubrobacteraceae bacterium]
MWALLRMCQSVTDGGIKSLVLPAQMTFQQPAQPTVEQTVAEGDEYSPVVVSKSELTINAAGAWHATCYAVNQNSATDVDVDFQIDLLGANGTTIWSATVSWQVAAADDGVPDGLAIEGVPAQSTFSQAGTDVAVASDRQLWAEIVSAKASFASNNLAAVPLGGQ